MKQPLEIAVGSAVDDISVFLGALPADEYEQRRRIRVCRNAACFKATQAESPQARSLCWMVTETASAWIYEPASVDELTEVARFLKRLLIVADQAEALAVVYG